MNIINMISLLRKKCGLFFSLLFAFSLVACNGNGGNVGHGGGGGGVGGATEEVGPEGGVSQLLPEGVVGARFVIRGNGLLFELEISNVRSDANAWESAISGTMTVTGSDDELSEITGKSFSLVSGRLERCNSQGEKALYMSLTTESEPGNEEAALSINRMKLDLNTDGNMSIGNIISMDSASISYKSDVYNHERIDISAPECYLENAEIMLTNFLRVSE